jgi:hypothetical protein
VGSVQHPNLSGGWYVKEAKAKAKENLREKFTSVHHHSPKLGTDGSLLS